MVLIVAGAHSAWPASVATTSWDAKGCPSQTTFITCHSASEMETVAIESTSLIRLRV
jgi:hypothetical protein